jgi:MFS family permease
MDSGASQYALAEGTRRRRQRTRALVASTVGTAIDWYDFALYSTAASLYIGKLFFPGKDPLLSSLAAFGTFFIGFLARPVGAAIFGRLGDRVGRKSTLIATLVLMALATFLIGLVPPYAVLGIWGGVLLIALRAVQGIAAGGEWGGAVLLTVEWGERRNRGFLGAWPQLGVPAGTLLSHGAIQASTLWLGVNSYWGWRIPFLASLVLLAVGLYIRLGVLETPVFTGLLETRKTERMPLVTVFKLHWREVLLTSLMGTSVLSASYLFGTFILTYGVTALRVAQPVMLNYTLVFYGLSLFTVLLFGYLSDRVGHKRMFILGAVALMLFALPYWGLMDTRLPALMLLASILAAPARDIMFGAQPSLLAESFTGRVRYTGASLGYQLSAVFGGGLAPIIALSLYRTYHSSTPIAFYMIGTAALAIVATALLRDRSRRDLAVEYDEPSAGEPTLAPARA